MAADSDIVKLSNFISSKVGELDGYHRAQNGPNSSTTIDTSLVVPLPPHQMQTKVEILTAIDKLKSLIQDPMEKLVEIFGQAHVNTMPALHAVVKHEIASKINVGEELTYQQLSERCLLNEPDLRRVMRMLVCMGLFIEPRKGFITHNSSSRLLHDSPALSNWLSYGTRYLWPVSYTTTDAMAKWPNGQELDETAFYLLRGETFWDSLNNDPKNAQLFAGAMGFLQSSPQFGSHHLLRGLEWDQSNCPKLMVDVGGHNGSIAADILRRYPVTKCIVEDKIEVISAASIPDDLQGRLEFKEHDFFTPQPIEADVYLLRSICHDWSDKYAVNIISNLIPALKPGARVIVNEVCMPDPGVIPRQLEATIRSYDLCMKQLFNSKERSIEEWEALFQGCDKRFKLSRLKMSPGSALAVIEFTWDV